MTRVIDLVDLSFLHSGAELPALNDVSLVVEAGEAVVLLGPSGAGKTTLLALLDGRLQGWTGCVSVLGRGLAPDGLIILRPAALGRRHAPPGPL